MNNLYKYLLIYPALLTLPFNAHGVQECEYAPSCTAPRSVYVRICSQDVRDDIRLPMRAFPSAYFSLVDTGGMSSEPIEYVTSIQGVADYIKRLTRQCKRVGRLAIYSHGSDGAIALGSDYGTEGIIPGMESVPGLASMGNLTMYRAADMYNNLSGLSCAMAPSSDVYFSACSTSSGCDGADFLAAVGSALLRGKGGRVVASSTETFAGIPWGGYSRGIVSANSVTVNSAGEITRANHSIPTAAKCATQVRNSLNVLSSLPDLSSCSYEGRSMSLMRANAESDLRQVLAHYETAGDRPLQRGNSEHLRYSQMYSSSIQNVRMLRGIGQSISQHPEARQHFCGSTSPSPASDSDGTSAAE